MRSCFVIIFFSCTMTAATAEQLPAIGGSYVTTVQGVWLQLSLVPQALGGFVALVDVPQQGAVGIPCPSVALKGTSLTISCPLIRASWDGEVGKSGKTLTGFWSQGARLSANWERVNVTQKFEDGINGLWQGMLGTPERPLRVRLKISDGGRTCRVSSIDEAQLDKSCEVASYKEPISSFRLTVPAIRGVWSGGLSRDGGFLVGTWTQASAGGNTPLYFVRTQAADAVSQR